MVCYYQKILIQKQIKFKYSTKLPRKLQKHKPITQLITNANARTFLLNNRLKINVFYKPQDPS